MEYRAVFKCRLCGETYESGCATGNKIVALLSATGACVGKQIQPQGPILTEVHSCKNGDFGIADFQGFRKH